MVIVIFISAISLVEGGGGGGGLNQEFGDT